MKINGNEIRIGNVIEHQDRLWVAVKTDHVKPGKGGAYAQVELKDIRSGTKLNERFRASESVERVRLEQKDYQYLYTDGETWTFMDNETYEQVELKSNIVDEDKAKWLQDGMAVMIESYEEEALSISLPDTVVLEVIEADPVVKGQTAAASYKPAQMDNGVRVMVPPFITTGEKVVVKPATGDYVERAK